MHVVIWCYVQYLQHVYDDFLPARFCFNSKPVQCVCVCVQLKKIYIMVAPVLRYSRVTPGGRGGGREIFSNRQKNPSQIFPSTEGPIHRAIREE